MSEWIDDAAAQPLLIFIACFVVGDGNRVGMSQVKVINIISPYYFPPHPQQRSCCC